jgi:hypothetical protein
MWAVFLAKADEPKCGEIVEKIMKRREGISVANSMLRTISQDEYERARFHSRKMALQDAEHNRVVTLKEGKEIGEKNVFDAFEALGADPELIGRVAEYINSQKR